MDLSMPRKRGRPRKRPLPEDENTAAGRGSGPDPKKRALSVRPMAMVGRYVLKEFAGKKFLGKVVYYDTGLYRIEYEDGDQEDLESGELRRIVIHDNNFTDELNRRRKKLDKMIADAVAKQVSVPEKNQVNDVEASSLSELSSVPVREDNGDRVGGECGGGHADSSSDSCEYGEDGDSGLESVARAIPPAPQLPPSSGSIGIAEEYVSHLLSVYGFLRSFSVALYLYPFGLDDFVGALNSSLPNSLLDAIHVTLMCSLRRHLEIVSSNGSELASRCLRCIDWNLLDTLTWPIYVLHYLTVMGHVSGQEWKGFREDVLLRDYYSLSVGKKLLVLQILCDHALDCADLRAEMDMREESEVGIDLDGAASNISQNGTRVVHQRYCKTTSFLNREAAGAFAASYEMKPHTYLNCKANGSEGVQVVAEAANLGEDGNGDECRLCGMDGTLLCCDGCPSAYHARCIGLVKMHIPEGSWYCPECMINRIGPSITSGTSLFGADMFGIDPYEQVFLGTCNHLLVLKASMSDRLCLRYYNQKDIVKVLEAINTSPQHSTLYSDICKGIIRYWNIADNVFSLPKVNEIQTKQVNDNDINISSQPFISSVDGGEKILGATGIENLTGVHGGDGVPIATPIQTFVNETTHSEIAGHHISSNSNMVNNGPPVDMMLLEHIKMDSASSSGSVIQQADPSDVTHQVSVDRSSASNYVCTSRNSSGSCNGHSRGIGLLNAKSYHNKHCFSVGLGGGARNVGDNCMYTGALFRPQAYINNYIHGFIAATAAANLATLSAEEGQISEVHVSGSYKKVTSAGSHQMKAFILATPRFFWPISEKKLGEVPRERCGWCYTCKAQVISRRGCMLNAAALLTSKSTTKILSGLPPTKHGQGSLSSIAMYILLMEESFRGLIVGPFLSGTQRKEWCERVADAADCIALKALLLELEGHIRPIALSGDWNKPVDDCLIEASVTQGVSSTVDTAQKRGPGRRRKNAALSDVASDDNSQDKSFSWWRGGKVLKLLLHKAVLPRSLVKRAARQGGSRKIPGVHYYYGTEIPRRSRQLAWRAAVETSKNSSQLALQVRYLDSYLRWSDLVRPEQSPQDAKGPELEFSVFRNALICDKKYLERKVLYAVDFGIQKHLPSRVMKSIIDIEQSQEGKEKYWFSEAHIPLYLIKEYEEGVDGLPMRSEQMRSFPHIQRVQLKAARVDIFSYLAYRRDNVNKFSCSSCQRDVPLRSAVKCSSCQGYCHEQCIVGSRIVANGFSCRQCFNAKAFLRKESTESPTSPLLLQTRENHANGTIIRFPKVKGCSQPLASARAMDNGEDIKHFISGSSLATKSRAKLPTWGVIWRKKNCDDTGSEFRLNNILLRGDADLRWSGPVCHLCGKSYDSGLMYIRCQTCTHWFHADAVELTESRIFDVVGFKCCKCRRIKSPECPYDDKSKNRTVKKQQSLAIKQESESDLGYTSELRDCEPTTPIFPHEEMQIQEEDPLLQSMSRVHQIADNNWELDFGQVSGPGPALQKLPVRRHVKQDGAADSLLENNCFYSESSTSMEMNIPMDQTGDAMIPAAAWDIPGNGLDGDVLIGYESFDYGEMEYEPQTYFSFTELLASDDGDQFDEAHAIEDVSGKWETAASASLESGVPEDLGEAPSDNGVGQTSSEMSGVAVPCRICTCSDPTPDLCCQFCGLCVHSGCSPWGGMKAGESDWKCGDCREWK